MSMNRVFDRRVKFDERSRNFPIRALITQREPRSYTWHCKVCLDQGNESSCTGHAVAHEAAARPVEVQGVTHALAVEIYNRAKQIDEWPGENYEGSSVLAAMKAGMERGWYKEYRWAFGEEDLALAVSYKGPAVLGIPWYEGMMEPSIGGGIIYPTGREVGGHAILCNGFNKRTGLYRLHNSWGTSWGFGGDCFVTRDGMAKLLANQGEACIPVIRTK